MSTSGSGFLDTIVGELVLLGGQRQSDATHMAVLTPPRRAHADRRCETLFVFLDLGGGGAGSLARVMLERFSLTYWRRGGTVTTALRQAINAANAHMLEENRLLAVSHRRRGGIVCAVLRENSLYLAQVGPAQALLAQGERVMELPAGPGEGASARQGEDRWDVGTAAQPARSPLGISSGLDIRFSHKYLNAGDMWLLTGESWSEGLPDGALAAALAYGGAEEAMLSLERRTTTGAVSALVVECVPHEMSPAPSSSAARHEQSFGADAVAESESSGRWRLSNPLAGVSIKPGWRESLREAGLAVSDSARTLLTRVLPEPEPVPRQRRGRTGLATADNVLVMAGIAVAIPVLVAFVVVSVYLQRSTIARHDGLLTETDRAIQAAREASAEDARGLWEEALQAAQAALDSAPDDAQLLTVRNEALSKLDALDGVKRPELAQLWDYGVGENRCVAAATMQVYVLDPARDQVTQHTLNQARQGDGSVQPNLVAYRGESVGDGQIGELSDIVWLEASGPWSSDALLILTSDHKLLQYSLSWGVSWVSFETGLAHVNGHDMRPFQGKLYILDPEQNQVWRFLVTDDGFGPPEGYFPAAAPDLSTATDMSIDGAVYILLGDGRIFKFFGGEEQEFQPTGLPQSLVRPVALVSEGDVTSGALYVADAGLQSIVALTKDGRFIHQIKAPVSAQAGALADLEALSIEERSRTLYALAGGRLYALDLPSLPDLSSTSD